MHFLLFKKDGQADESLASCISFLSMPIAMGICKIIAIAARECKLVNCVPQRRLLVVPFQMMRGVARARTAGTKTAQDRLAGTQHTHSISAAI